MAKMYEDYLESFVFKTAKLIAMKLFGKERKSRRNGEQKPEETENEQSEDEPKKDDLNANEEKTLVKSNSQENLENNEENEKEEEVGKMLDDLMVKQQEEKSSNEKSQDTSRVEYESLTEGLDEINFHFALFFLLIVITLIAIPSSITWAKNYHYAKILSPDPFKFPATIVLISLGLIWQLNTPRKV